MTSRAKRDIALAAMHNAVLAGATAKAAAADSGLHLSTYRLWKIRNGFLTPREPMPKAAQFKSADREIREQLSSTQICQKHGIKLSQLYAWRRDTGGLPK